MKLRLLILFFGVVLGCSKSNDDTSADLQTDAQSACISEAPLEIPWMKELIATMDCGKYSCEISLMHSVYEDQTVFYTLITDPFCDYQAHLFLYDCTGTMIKEMTDQESNEYLDKLYLETLDGKEVQTKLYSCNGTN
jgi:hypothetical protein